MEGFIQTWNTLMGLAVIGGILVSAVLAYTLLFSAKVNPITSFVRKNILVIGLVISLSALITSLTYSEIIGYPPCTLCWWARVFFYPQIILFGMALVRKDMGILPYATAITFTGLLFSTYHYIVESVQYSPVPCSSAGASCLTRYVYEFGFVTIPLMGLVGFLVLLFSLLLARRG